MNNIERTIEQLKETKEHVANTSYEVNRGVRCNAIDLAIQALQEKAERENPKPLKLEEIKAIKRPIPLYKKLLTNETGEYIGPNDEWWDVCCGTTEASGVVYWRSGHTNNVSDYGKIWLAYDYEPKEATDDR